MRQWIFQRRTVLMIEDEDAIVAPLTESLTREGFAPVTAGTIAEGLQIARTQAPDLVLLDVMLPDGSGFDALRELRSMGSTPVIMLTARGDEADRVAGLELGADDYVIKPFSVAASSWPGSGRCCGGSARLPIRLGVRQSGSAL